MTNYRNEAAFSKALCSCMKRKGYFVQRIESGETGRGIPDIYAVIGETPVWLELKRVHHCMRPSETIPWRPGQQAWLHTIGKYKQCVFTLCCFDNGVLQIPHNKVYPGNVVRTDMYKFYKDIKALF